MTLLVLIAFAVVAPGLFALAFAAYQSRASVAEFWTTFRQMFVFYVILGAPIILGFYGAYLVLAALFGGAHAHR